MESNQSKMSNLWGWISRNQKVNYHSFVRTRMLRKIKTWYLIYSDKIRAPHGTRISRPLSKLAQKFTNNIRHLLPQKTTHEIWDRLNKRIPWCKVTPAHLKIKWLVAMRQINLIKRHKYKFSMMNSWQYKLMEMTILLTRLFNLKKLHLEFLNFALQCAVIAANQGYFGIKNLKSTNLAAKHFEILQPRLKKCN